MPKSFIATAANGEKIVITVEESFTEYSNRGGSHRKLTGVRLLLPSGEPINRVEKGVYRTLDGVDLTSDDPSAA